MDNSLDGMPMQAPTKKEIIRILNTSIENYTELGPDGLETTNVETQILHFAIFYLLSQENDEQDGTN